MLGFDFIIAQLGCDIWYAKIKSTLIYVLEGEIWQLHINFIFFSFETEMTPTQSLIVRLSAACSNGSQ